MTPAGKILIMEDIKMTGRIELPRERAMVKEKTAALMAEAEKRILEEKRQAEEDYFIRLTDENHKRFLERQAQQVQQEQIQIPQKTAPKMTRKQAMAQKKRKLWQKFWQGMLTGAVTVMLLTGILIRAGVL